MTQTCKDASQKRLVWDMKETGSMCGLLELSFVFISLHTESFSRNIQKDHFVFVCVDLQWKSSPTSAWMVFKYRNDQHALAVSALYTCLHIKNTHNSMLVLPLAFPAQPCVLAWNRQKKDRVKQNVRISERSMFYPLKKYNALQNRSTQN